MAAGPPGRDGPRRITFVTSPDDCNLACDMCRDHSPLARRAPRPRRRLPVALVERVLAERQGSPLSEVIPSTRGEPLLWAGLDRLVDLCLERALLLNVTTNGTFPGRGPRAWAARLAGAASDVKISWNAATPATAARIAPGLRLDRAVDDLRAFLDVRDAVRAEGRRACRVSLQVTAREANVAELPEVVRLAASLGVERVKVNQLQVHFPELAGEDLRRDRASRARWNRAVHGMRAAGEAHPLRSGAALLLENVEPWPEEGELLAGACPFLGREAWIAADGRFAPCPAPAAQDGLLGDLGRVDERSIGEIWSSREYRELVRDHREREPCRRCPLRRTGGA